MAAPSVSENRHRLKKHQSESIPLPLLLTAFIAAPAIAGTRWS